MRSRSNFLLHRASPGHPLLRVALWASIISLSGTASSAAVVAAASASRNDVAAAISSARDGDTVTIPAATATWTDSLTINKQITLQGAGAGRTIIIDDLPQDNSLITVNSEAGGRYRISGIEFRNGSRTNIGISGIINLTGSSDSVRVDNCRFFRIRNRGIRTGGYVRGVIDHNEFIMNVDAHCVHMWHQSWGGGVLGDKSWSEEIDWGGPNALYIEDNLFVAEPNIPSVAVTDTYAGTRFVFRYNRLNRATIATHGTGDGAGRNRGLRHWEIYNNVWESDEVQSKNAIHIRGGTGVAFNNTLNNYTKFLTLHYYRFYSAHGKFGELNGLNLFDRTDSKVYASGNAGSGSGENTLVVSGANWAPDQWKGYITFVPNSSVNPRGTFASVVVTNTTDTITVRAGSQAANVEAERKIFVPGERFEIRRVSLGLDQTGAGTSDLLTDTSADPIPVNLNQKTDPVYVWNNSMTGVRAPLIADGGPGILEGVHWFNDTPRPGYTPYVYPHPLISGAPPPPPSDPVPTAPAAPSSLRVTGT